MNKVVVFVGICISFYGLFLYGLHLSYFKKFVQQKQISIIQCATDIPKGRTLSRSLLKGVSIPNPFLSKYHVLADQMEIVLGQSTVHVLKKGDLLRWTDLKVRDQGKRSYSFSEIIPEDMRGYTLLIPSTNFASLLEVGDHVDILVSGDFFHTGQLMTTVLLQGIKIVAIGDRVYDGYSDSVVGGLSDFTSTTNISYLDKESKLITVLVNPIDALILKQGISSSSSVIFALKHAKDVSAKRVVPYVTTELLLP